jgi:hypothetical protein
LAQSKVPGAPSNAPPRTDVTTKAEDIANNVGAFFDNADMWSNYVRQEKISTRLTDYLNQIGAKPTAGEIHIFYVQALIRDNGSVNLEDFQYLANGKSVEDALRESFAVENAPGSERLDAKPLSANLVGIFVTATPEDGKFVIRGGPLSKEFSQKIRQEGFALHDKRAKDLAEAQRIEGIRQKRAANHAAGDVEAHRQLQVARERGPPRSGVELSGSGPPSAKPPDLKVYLPPTKSGSQSAASPAVPLQSLPVAHPPVKFNQPPPRLHRRHRALAQL